MNKKTLHKSITVLALLLIIGDFAHAKFQINSGTTSYYSYKIEKPNGTKLEDATTQLLLPGQLMSEGIQQKILIIRKELEEKYGIEYSNSISDDQIYFDYLTTDDQ